MRDRNSDGQKGNSTAFPGTLLARNVIYNLLGQGLPVLVAIIAIPFIVRGLGTERFGVLTLAWMVVGYFSLFNLGVGRATTKYAAEYIGRGEEDKLPQLISTSLIILLIFGLASFLVTFALIPLLVNSILKIPGELKAESLKAFYLLAVSVPFVLCAAGARGVLEAQQRFGLVNAVRIPASMINFLAPLVVLAFTRSLYSIVAVLVICRVLVVFTYVYFCFSSVSAIRTPRRPSLGIVKKLLGFGGWLTVSNVIDPFLTYMDRFIIGAMLSMSSVAFYSVPYDVVTKLWIISGGLLGVLFPAFSACLTVDAKKFDGLYERAAKYILATVSPIVLAIVLLAEPMLSVWLGREFAEHSMLVLQLLSIGVLICALAQLPFSAIQASDRPDITAKFHLMELPIYLVMLFAMVPKLGIVGVAIAWLCRVTLDNILLFVFAHRTLPVRNAHGKLVVPVLVVTSAAVLSLSLSAVVPNASATVISLCIIIISLCTYFWKILSKREKDMILSFGNKIIHFGGYRE